MGDILAGAGGDVGQTTQRGEAAATLRSALAASRRRAKQRATLEARMCSRPGCGRAFQPRLSGGRPQEFCTPECRLRFNDESRRQGRRRAKKRARLRLAPSSWGWGTDVATGRRLALPVQSPLADQRTIWRAPRFGPSSAP
jgi:hypothetical protein